MKHLLAIALIFAPLIAKADDPKSPAEVYVASDYFQQIYDSYVDIDVLKKRIKLQSPGLSDADTAKAASISREEYLKVLPELEEIYVAVIDEIYTDEELIALNEFLASPAGRAFFKKDPQFVRQSDEAAWPILEKAYRRIEKRFQQETWTYQK